MELSEINFEKDLAWVLAWTTSTLKPSLHCDKAAANATKFLRLLKKTFSTFSKDLCIFLAILAGAIKYKCHIMVSLPRFIQSHI